MAGIHEKYDFYLDVPGIGVSQAFPTMKRLTWKWDKSNKFPRKTLSSSLTFYDNPAEEINDFTKVYPLERERRRCDRIKMRIDKKCPGGGISEFWQGYWYVTDGKPWNVSHCEVTVKPETLDDYQCILDKEDQILNLLEYGTPTIIKDTFGTIQYLTCEATRFSEGRISPRDPINYDFLHAVDCLDDPNSATILRNDVQGSTLPDGRYQYIIKTQYVREFVSGTSTPPGNGWITVDGGFARPVDVILLEDEDFNRVYEVARLGTIPNALPFNEVMENIMLDLCPQVNMVSNYFGINPDGTNPDNQFYQVAATNYQEMYYIPKSEILYFGASDRATATPEVTLKKLLGDLYNMFAVEIRIREGVLYLEHESYFKGNAMLNLREEVFEWYMKGAFKYEYINAQIPRTEKWLFADMTDEIGDFDYSTIEYVPCSTEPSTEKSYKNQVISTNIAGIIRSAKKDDGRVSPNGVALVACDEKVILFDTGKISGRPIVNGPLSWPLLIVNALSYRRPLLEGKFHLEYLAFLKPWPQRKWVGKICLSCEDLDQFDMEDLVQTVLPWGEVDNATYDEPDGILTLEVLHD